MKSEEIKLQEEIKGEPENHEQHLVEDDQSLISNKSSSKSQLQITNNKSHLPDKKIPKAVVYSALFTPAISFATGALFSFFNELTLIGIACFIPAIITFCVGAIYARKYSESQQPNELSSRSKGKSQSMTRYPGLPGTEIESKNQDHKTSQSSQSQKDKNIIESISRPSTLETNPSPQVSDAKSSKAKSDSIEQELA